jgi:hypothetical protein
LNILARAFPWFWLWTGYLLATARFSMRRLQLFGTNTGAFFSMKSKKLMNIFQEEKDE